MSILVLDSGDQVDLSLYPLPKDVLPENASVDDLVFNMAEIAKALGTSTVTVGKWVDEGMPVHKRGGNGQSYEFRLDHCYAWRKWRNDRTEAAKKLRDNVAGQIAMEFLGGEDEVGDLGGRLSPKEMREYALAELERNKAAEQRGDLVRRSQVESILEDILVAYRHAMVSLPDWLEQEFSLSPHQVDKAQKFCDGILDETRNQISLAGFEGREVVHLKAGEEKARDG